jgi:Na+-transporting methylmalonyl-CoA/oxaloacetate decarboxylase gamma subunit
MTTEMTNLQPLVLITLAGIGLVFLVLALLLLSMVLLKRTDRRVPAQSAQPAVSQQGALGEDSLVVADDPPAGELSPEMLAAVMVAVRMHRRVRRKQAAPAMRTHQPGTLPSRWVGAGRVSQNQSWHPHRR